jgi:hypothetical protein
MLNPQIDLGMLIPIVFKLQSNFSPTLSVAKSITILSTPWGSTECDTRMRADSPTFKSSIGIQYMAEVSIKSPSAQKHYVPN